MLVLSKVVIAHRVAGLQDLVAAKADAASVLGGTVSTLNASRRSVQAGRSVKLTGKVTLGGGAAIVSAQAVALEAKSGSAWKTVTSQALGADGMVTFAVKPDRTTTYRLAYAGIGVLTPSVSSGRTITVTAAAPAPSSGSSSTSSASSAGWSNVAATGTGADIVAAAAVHIGKPYSYGASGPNAFDCSGLTSYVFRQFGVSLPHKANSQLAYGRPVSRADAAPGDLIIFLSDGYGYHVGIYAGGGYMIDAPGSGRTVGRHQIWSSNVVFRRLT
jgi:cell wall-associated NlpC family hydrolase